MVNAALIVFRESLEAALIIGIVAAATQMIRHRAAWIALGVAMGLAGALGIASVAGQIAQWANGMGHDLFNALVLGLAVAMLAWHNIWMSSHGRQFAEQAQTVGAAVSRGELAMSAVTLAIALTVLREGAETVLFFYGILAGSGLASTSMVEGALLGLAGGITAGVLIYRGLMRIPVRHFFTATAWLLLFVTAGMAAQLAQILVQADILSPIMQPVWDTSRWLPQDSSLGTLLHALVGYDPAPSATQIMFAATVLVCILLATRYVTRLARDR